MDKEHKKKVNEALKLCESSMQYVFEQVDKWTEDKKRAKEIQQFLLQNTFFAGGLFRSIFTGMPVNDIDVFFDNEDAVFQFRHICATDLKALFKNEKTLSGQFTYYIKRAKSPDISFITSYAGPPKVVCNHFDYTFNQHYFSMRDYDMMIDIGTFAKEGQLVKLEGDPVANMGRAMRFMSEGFKLNNWSKAELMSALVEMKSLKREDTYNQIEKFSDRLAGGGSGSGEKIRTSSSFSNLKYYTEDYFDEPEKTTLSGSTNLGIAAQRTFTVGQGHWGEILNTFPTPLLQDAQAQEAQVRARREAEDAERLLQQLQ